MATFDGSTSLEMACDEFREHECGPCALGGKTREAKHYCIDCPDYLCDDCKAYHCNRADRTRFHVIVLSSRNLADLASSMSLNMASDGFREHECDPCLLIGKTRKATYDCVDCPYYLCDDCKVYHGKQAGTRNHSLVSSSLIAGIKTLGSVNAQRKGTRQDNKLPGKSHSTGSSKMLMDRKIKSRSEVNVRTIKDRKNPCIPGCTVMPSGHVVLCYRSDNQIKLLDNSWTITGRLALQDPWDVSVIDSNNVIVSSLLKNQLQKVQVFPRLKAGSIIKLDMECWGVSVSGEEIYTTCHDNFGQGEVRVLDLQGQIKRRLGINPDGSHLFTSPYYITVSNSGEKIFISDGGTHTITCLTTTGTVIYSYKDDYMRFPRGLICDSGDNVLVCGLGHDNVRTISPDGNKCHTLLTSQDGLRYPRSVAYKESEDTLIVGCEDSSKLLLFKLT